MGSTLFGGIIALALGASMFAGELSAHRLGFFYTRPLHWSAIWGGKVLAAVLLPLAAGLLVWIPAAAAAKDRALGLAAMWDLQGAVYLLGLLLLVVGVANLGSLAFRARSPWLAFDIVAIPLAAWLMNNVVGPRVARADIAIPWLLSLYVWPLGLALLAASAAQAALGRTALVRSHRIASLTFWSLFLLIPLGWWLAVP